MQVSSAATPGAIYTITIDITKSQVSMLAKKESTIVEQGKKSSECLDAFKSYVS